MTAAQQTSPLQNTFLTKATKPKKHPTFLWSAFTTNVCRPSSLRLPASRVPRVRSRTEERKERERPSK